MSSLFFTFFGVNVVRTVWEVIPVSLYDTKTAAKWLSISEWTLRKWEREHRIHAVRLGGAVRYEDEELRRFIEAAKARAAARRDGEL